MPIEALHPGNQVITVHGGPLLQPLIWVGRLQVNLARHPRPASVAPVLLRAGALGDGTPYRDLRVGPDHALFLAGRLVPARLLVNGDAIVQESWCQAVTYHHIELVQHGLVISEGAVSETYIDDGGRHLFDNAVVAALPVNVAGRRGHGRHADAVCAPVLAEGDPTLGALRRRLAAATAQGAAPRQACPPKA